MRYSTFCDYLQQLDITSKRLEITKTLADLVKELDPKEVKKALYLSLGYLNPPYNQIKFNMADKMVIRSLTLCYSIESNEVIDLYSKMGDLGNVAEKLANQKTKLKTEVELSVLEIHQKLVELAQDDGSGSQDRKITQLSNILKLLSPLSAKYTVRIVLGTTRLGFTEQTIIDALSNLIGQDKSLSRQIEEAYNIHPDIGVIACILKKEGTKGLKQIQIETGVPVLSQKAQRLSDPVEILEKVGGIAWVENKLDGTRVQLHMDRNKRHTDTKLDQNNLFSFNKEAALVKTYTRNLEENTYQFPDLVEAALKQIDAQSIILDGEAIGYDPKSQTYIPFQDMMQRKRKHNVGSYTKQIPLKYIIFDILYLNGKALASETLSNRHVELEKAIKPGSILEVAEHHETTDSNELWKLFEVSKKKNLEGIMIKNPQTTYRAGAREFSWIKLKRSNTEILEDTFDCIVLGYYYGRGTRADFGIGGFLCGIWNRDEQIFTTFTKVGTGLKDEEWVELKKRCDLLKIENEPKNVTVPKILKPDVWTHPKIIVELGGDEISVSQTHTSGYALRFPRLIRFRDDKSPTDITSLTEVTNMLKAQRKR